MEIDMICSQCGGKIKGYWDQKAYTRGEYIASFVVYPCEFCFSAEEELIKKTKETLEANR